MRAPYRMLALWLAAMACGDSVDPVPLTLATGTFMLERVDNAPIPQRIARAGSDSSDVTGGLLIINLATARLTFDLHSIRRDGHDVIESYNMPLRVAAPDSFAALHWRGRAWGDTADLITTGAAFGTHRMRLVRLDER